MDSLFRKILLVGSCLLITICIYGQANVSLSVSPSQINKDEYATLKIIVENAKDIQQVIPPSFKKFIVLSGPNQETSMTSVNGQVKQYAALSFILKPTETGKINIEPALIRIAGKAYKTNATALFVKNTLSANNAGTSLGKSHFPFTDPFKAPRPSSEFNDYIFHKGDNVADKVNKNMQLKLETDKTSCFVGEPIVASYKLYTRLKSESKLTGNPSFNGFSVIDMTRADNAEYTKQKLNGREYNVYTIRKAQLYPLQPGTIELEPAELENNIQFIKDDYVNKRQNDVFDLFDNFAQATVPPEGIISQTVSLRSKPVGIIVKPLPEANKPASFNGAVGEFVMEASLQRTNFPANESGKLIVRISGKGNLQILTAPSLNWPQGIDAFDPQVSESISKFTVPISGSKTFEYSFSANKPGEYILPAINFSYFNPHTASYKIIATKEFPFTVSTSTAPAITATVPATPKETASGINKIFNNRWWIIVFIAAITLTGILIWVKRDKTNSPEMNVPDKTAEDTKLETIIETSAINQQNPLLKTEVCLYQDDCEGFYTLLNSELKNFLSHKFSLDPAEMNIKNIIVTMDKKNIDNDTVLQLQQLLQEIEWQLYTPFERNDRMKELYQQAQDIIQRIHTTNIKHR